MPSRSGSDSADLGRDEQAEADRLERLRRAMTAVSSGQQSPDEALAALGERFDPLLDVESAAVVPPTSPAPTSPTPTVPAPSSARPAPDDRIGGEQDDDIVAAEPRRRTTRSSWGTPKSRAGGADGDVEPRTETDWETLAREVVLRRLSVKARTRQELADSLGESEVPVGIAERVLDRMTEVGLVDDAAFARDWVAARQERKHLSRRMLLDELRRKGIDPVLAEEAASGVGQAEEYDAAVELARRKLESLSRHPYEVQRRRLAGALERRGFGVGLIHRVVDDVLVRVP